MPYLRNPVLATFIYYDVFDYPLTLQEVYEYLINPARISKVSGIEEVNIADVQKELIRLRSSGILSTKDEFYFLNGRDNICDLRWERKNIAKKKWRRLIKIMPYLSIAPYLMGIFVSGSMSIDNTDEESDFDVLVIVKSGRLYTCRFFLWLISSLMMVRRKKDEKIAPNKLCFNHYITDDNLYLAHESLFNAQTYINLKPTMIPAELVNKFFTSNIWLNNFVYNFKNKSLSVDKIAKPPIPILILKRFLELIFNSFFGNWIEKILKQIQQNKIKNNPLTFEGGGRVVWNDNELEFHPHSFEAYVIRRYNAGLKKFGIMPYFTEKDSGLNKF